MKHALHLGTTPWLSGHTATHLADQAAFAEALGFASFWLPESHFTGVRSIPDPLMLLAAAAAGTKKIGLGTTSLLLPLRHPVLIAEQVAVLDQLSEGRVILGVGRGFRPEMLAVFDVEPKLKRQQFANCLAQMIRAWKGESLLSEAHSSSNKIDVTEAIVLQPETWQKPHPPIWVAAFGPKALAQAGGLGLPYLASPLESLERLQDNYWVHRDACLEADCALPEVVPIMRNIFISRKRSELNQVKKLLDQQMLELAASGITRYAAKVVTDWALIGEPSEVSDKIAQYQEQLGMTHLINARIRIEGITQSARIRSLESLAVFC